MFTKCFLSDRRHTQKRLRKDQLHKAALYGWHADPSDMEIPMLSNIWTEYFSMKLFEVQLLKTVSDIRLRLEQNHKKYMHRNMLFF